MIVTTGLTLLASQLTTDLFAKWGSVGIGTTAPVAGNTTLESEEATVTRVASTFATSTNTFTYTTTFPAGNPSAATVAVTEFGLFSASSAGTMFIRETLSGSGYSKDSTDSITFTTVITVS